MVSLAALGLAGEGHRGKPMVSLAALGLAGERQRGKPMVSLLEPPFLWLARARRVASYRVLPANIGG